MAGELIFGVTNGVIKHLSKINSLAFLQFATSRILQFMKPLKKIGNLTTEGN
jgi:hypothetical protein